MERNKNIEEVLQSMDFEFFGNSKHKISPDALLKTEGAVLLDVRSMIEYETISFNLIHNISMLHIPVDKIPERLSEIQKDKMTGIFCSSSVRASMTYLYLRALGYENVRILQGGYDSLVAELKTGKLYKYIKSQKK